MRSMRLSLKSRRALLGLAFISPWLIGFIFLFATPLPQSVRFSLSNLSVAPNGYVLEFVGLKNVKDALLVDAAFNRILVDSVWAIFAERADDFVFQPVYGGTA